MQILVGRREPEHAQGDAPAHQIAVQRGRRPRRRRVERLLGVDAELLVPLDRDQGGQPMPGGGPGAQVADALAEILTRARCERADACRGGGRPAPLLLAVSGGDAHPPGPQLIHDLGTGPRRPGLTPPIAASAGAADGGAGLSQLGQCGVHPAGR
ncbi:hypothetical protein Asp14428_16560 [Actinoplanes sp. NBRC 14428]|nr:hypothetical protein Asp14428_16560 [Actinoplanes sp. NBRC 14428]